MSEDRHRRWPRTVWAAVAVTLLAACGGGDRDAPSADAQASGGELSAVVASFDLAIGPPARFLVAMLDADRRNLGHGRVDLAFTYLGEGTSEMTDTPGPSAEASYLPIPGTETDNPPDTPRFLLPSQGRGVYAAEVGFDRAGFWEVEVHADVDGDGRRSATTAFEVLADHRVPAVGDPAPPSENLTSATAGVPAEAIDSRAIDGPVPDPELHQTTIAAAVAAGRPALVVFSTPVFCVSRFCGPVTDVVAGLAADYADRAAFIHVEIWDDFEAKRINAAAAEWLAAGGGDGNEPWVFLIGADGTIAARWDNVAARAEIEPLLRQLPANP